MLALLELYELDLRDEALDAVLAALDDDAAVLEEAAELLEPLHAEALSWARFLPTPA